MRGTLFIAAGGGGDVVAAPMAQRVLHECETAEPFHYASYSWDWLEVDPLPGPRDPTAFGRLEAGGAAELSAEHDPPLWLALDHAERPTAVPDQPQPRNRNHRGQHQRGSRRARYSLQLHRPAARGCLPQIRHPAHCVTHCQAADLPA